MIIKDLGAGVFSVWEGLRPKTKKLLFGALQSNSAASPNSSIKNFSYDAHADWELSRLLTALDEQSRTPASVKDPGHMREISQLAETCVRLLEAQSGSAEVFIQLAERAIKKHDYRQLDKLADRLLERFSAGEIAEIVRQTDMAQIRAIAYETLSMLPVPMVAALLDDPLYADIAANALEQQAVEYESEEAREALELYDMNDGFQNG